MCGGLHACLHLWLILLEQVCAPGLQSMGLFFDLAQQCMPSNCILSWRQACPQAGAVVQWLVRSLPLYMSK